MRRYQLVINDQPITVTVKSLSRGESQLEVEGEVYTVNLTREEVLAPATPTRPPSPAPTLAAPPPLTAAPHPGVVRAPIPGAILDVFVKPGDPVVAGQTLLKMEAMKMENTISAPMSGTVGTVSVQKASVVEQGQELLTLR